MIQCWKVSSTMYFNKIDSHCKCHLYFRSCVIYIWKHFLNYFTYSNVSTIFGSVCILGHENLINADCWYFREIGREITAQSSPRTRKMPDATRSQCQTPCKNIARTLRACFDWFLLHLPVVAITIRKSPLLRRCWEELLDSTSLPQRVQREVFVPWNSNMLKVRRSILPIFAF